MSETKYPESKYSDLVLRIDDDTIKEKIANWNARDDNNQHYHRKVLVKNDPYYFKLSWKIGAEEKLIGTFKLMTKILRNGGYIRWENKNKKHYRIRVVRENNLIYIKTHRGDKKIAIGEFLTHSGETKSRR